MQGRFDLLASPALLGEPREMLARPTFRPGSPRPPASSGRTSSIPTPPVLTPRQFRDLLTEATE